MDMFVLNILLIVPLVGLILTIIMMYYFLLLSTPKRFIKKWLKPETKTKSKESDFSNTFMETQRIFGEMQKETFSAMARLEMQIREQIRESEKMKKDAIEKAEKQRENEIRSRDRMTMLELNKPDFEIDKPEHITN